MPKFKLSRSEFVALSSKIIVETNAAITIVNQPEGYLKLHRAVRDEGCLEKLKMQRMLLLVSDTEELAEESALIHQAGFGTCDEIAAVIVYQLIQSLKAKKIEAIIQIIKSSTPISHAFVGVAIALKDEIEKSFWIVDGWDPAVVDTKNGDYFKYRNLIVQRSFNVSKVDVKKCTVAFERPLEGPPEDCPTPREDLAKKYRWMHTNIISIKDAIEEGLLSTHGTISAPQANRSNTFFKKISAENRQGKRCNDDKQAKEDNYEILEKKMKTQAIQNTPVCSNRVLCAYSVYNPEEETSSKKFRWEGSNIFRKNARPQTNGLEKTEDADLFMTK